MNFLTKASRSGEVTRREQDNLQIAYEAACEGMVLLKNDGALPFKTKKVALYGPGAAMTIKGGTGSGEVNERHSVTVLEGLQDRGFEISTMPWIDGYERFYAEAEKAYKIEKRKRINLLKMDSIMNMLFDNFRYPAGPMITEADVEQSATDCCIYVLSRQAGEGCDRRLEKGDYYLTEEEEAQIRFCAEHYASFVLVINCGSAVDMSVIDSIPGINAVLYICQLGTEGGHAVADVISGEVSPSGKLTDTWAKKYEDIPFAMDYSFLNGNLKDEYYKEGIYVGYRYFDSFHEEPAYPFGFGLGYTDFAVRSGGVSLNGTRVTVRADVQNVGKTYSGREVAQVYVTAPEGQIHKPWQSLAAFAKTEILAPGQRQQLEMTFDIRTMCSYREYDSCFVLEQGEYIVRLGNSSRNTAAVGVIYAERDIIVSRNQSICAGIELEELKAPGRKEEKLDPGLPYLLLDCDSILTIEFSYDEPVEDPDPRVQKILNTLTLTEMVDILVGIGMFGGETRFNLPGSVGNTTSKFWDRGLANVALCDGPAGLRIQKRSTVDEKGKIKPVELPLSIFNSFPGFIKKFIVGDPNRETVLYQYTTAFPVATALAQTWNQELMYRVGDAVYREMKEYGCTYWLAPAVNIHRNPLCGRNFEYFSEDPVLTGKMAAAITRGVQQEEGFYVTVKHFAANNQEEERNKVSSNLSERALREIYLRPFELAVRDGGAKGIMTSYNKVNGTYASNSYDLCTKALRNEWGFEGVVMTDWFSTNGGLANNALCIKAGNDLIMPGGGYFKKEILQGVKSGLIDEKDVRISCSRVIRAILDSATQREYIG